MPFRISAVQLQSALYDLNGNLSRAAAAIESAADNGSRVVLLPELATSGYGLDANGLARASDPVDGVVLRAWSALAKRLDIFIAGGFCEREGDRLYNSVLLVGPDGLAGHYRKLHLFDREKTVFTPGDKGLRVWRLPFAQVGLCVCYDLRFVEVVRALALQGADLILVPTAWVGGFDRVDVDASGFIGQVSGVLVQANLNQVFLACASQAGTVGGTRFLGSSLIVDPYGRLMAGPLGQTAEAIASSEIDTDDARAARARSDLIRPREDRRTDLYGVVVGGATY
jgi:predicted amidohydrolase